MIGDAGWKIRIYLSDREESISQNGNYDMESLVVFHRNGNVILEGGNKIVIKYMHLTFQLVQNGMQYSF